jgi:uncharacterized protein
LAEPDLERLLRELDPRVSPERYSFELTESPMLAADTFALIREDEGVTAIRSNPAGHWAHIAIGVLSDLKSVGLTAALSKRLADAGISANVVAALHHDHIFVPWDRREEALALLRSFA